MCRSAALACTARASAPNFSIVTFGADIGDLQNDKDTELRVSGGGFDHALKGKIFRATGEEGVSGVQVDIGNDDPLWQAFAEKNSVDYLVPGYKASSLDLTKGRDKIQQFVKACEIFDRTGPPAESAAAAGGDAEKEAFESAKELGTVEAWQAFITNYPSGFRADLARAYIKNLGSSEPAKQPVAKKVTGCEEGFKLVKGKCKRITANQPSQGCPAGTKPVPETDNCVPHHQQFEIRLQQGADQGQRQMHDQEPGGRLLRSRLPRARGQMRAGLRRAAGPAAVDAWLPARHGLEQRRRLPRGRLGGLW